MNDGSATTGPGPRTGGSEWKSHWRLVVASFAGSALAAVYSYSLGVTIAPLEQAFGWTRAQITSGFFVVSLFSVLFSFFMGLAIDRIGPRRIAIFGVALHCVALALLSQAGPSLPLWWAHWALIAVSILCIKPTVWVTAISSMFHLQRGLAFGVVLSATGFISFGVPSLTLKLISTYGWRDMYLILGAASALVVLPLVIAWFRSDADHPVDRSGQAAQAAVQRPGLTVKQGITSTNFYLLALGGFAMSFATIAVTINMVPILMSKAMVASTAAIIAGALGLSQIAGRLTGGYLLDRFDAKKVAALTVLLPALTALILLHLPAQWGFALAAAVTLGFAAGAEMDAVAYLCGKCFGLANFAALFGAFTGILTLGFGLGPVVGSLIYDKTGSYDPLLWGIIPLSLLSSLLFLKLRPFPDFGQ